MVADLPATANQLAPRLGALALVLSLLVPTAASSGKLYRWVDDQGQVHYTDRLPSEAADAAHSVIDESGTVMEQKDSSAVEREKSRQREAREAEYRRATAKQRREAQEQRRRDEIITQTFSTEADIEYTRDSRIEAVQVQLNIVEHGIGRLEEQRRLFQERLDRLPEDSPAVVQHHEQLAGIDERLAQRRKNRQQLKTKHAEIKQRFDGYLERFRELKGASGAP